MFLQSVGLDDIRPLAPTPLSLEPPNVSERKFSREDAETQR